MANIVISRGMFYCDECGGDMLRDARVCSRCSNTTNWGFDDCCLDIEVELDANFFDDFPEEIEAGLAGTRWRFNPKLRRILPLESFVLAEDERKEAIAELLATKERIKRENDYLD